MGDYEISSGAAGANLPFIATVQGVVAGRVTDARLADLGEVSSLVRRDEQY
ncbi:hypothetical protein ACWEQA_17025 [Nocardia sp. NPDC004085]